MAETKLISNELQLVVFDLASEYYGVDISDVREIIRMQSITRVPGTPEYLEAF
jgi:purine-binding chemotaxis protein CheW